MTIAAGIKRAATLADYLRLARFDHATKHVFILPGIALALLLRGTRNADWLLDVALGFVCAVAIASANYVINEWLDREFDKHHPTKSARTAVNVELNAGMVYALWAVFAIIGLGAAALSSGTMLVVAIVFAAQGIVYNVPPLRTKDRAFVDVLSESINNPLRLLIGWAMIDAATLPPSSIVAAYWLGGAFLMAAKRLSEYREITASHGLALLARYRRSFAGYSEISLFTSCFLYALLSVWLLATFMVKYRIEYVLLMPFLCVLFGVYMALALPAASVAQSPEKLFGERKLMLAVAVFAVAFGALTVVDIPTLEALTSQRFVTL